jgi:hypothetical protein
MCLWNWNIFNIDDKVWLFTLPSTPDAVHIMYPWRLELMLENIYV